MDEPEIGNVDEGIVEGGKDTGNAKDELALSKKVVLACMFFGCDKMVVSIRPRTRANSYHHGRKDRGRCSPGERG